MPSNHWNDWNDDQEWEPVVLKTATRYFDSAFVASVRALRANMRLDIPLFAARVPMTADAMRDLESGRLPYDTAVEHRLRALLQLQLQHKR